MKKHTGKREPVSRTRTVRRTVGVLLWAGGIAAGILGGNYGLPVALALFVIGFFVFVSGSTEKEKN